MHINWSRRGRGVFAASALLVASTLALAACSPTSSPSPSGSAADLETLNVGVIATITGDYAVYGQPFLNGVQVAQEYFADKGELDLKINHVNVNNDPADTVKAFRDFSDQGIKYVLDYDGSPPTLAGAPVAQSTGTLLFSAATSPKITESGDWIYQGPTQTARISAQGIVDALVSLGAKKIAIVVDNNDFGAGGSAAIKAAAEGTDLEIVTEQKLDPTSADFSTQVTAVLQAKPDAIAAFTLMQEGAIFMKQFRAAGGDQPAVGSISWVDAKYSGLAGSDGSKDVYAVTDFLPGASNLSDIAQKFITSYKAKFNEDPPTAAASGFDMVVMLAQAVKEAGSTDPEKVRKALGSVKVEGVTGSELSFNSDRQIVKTPIEVTLDGDTWVAVSK